MRTNYNTFLLNSTEHEKSFIILASDLLLPIEVVFLQEPQNQNETKRLSSLMILKKEYFDSKLKQYLDSKLKQKLSAIIFYT